MTEVETPRGLRRRPNPPDIYVIDADGSNEIRLTSGPGFDKRPSWLSRAERDCTSRPEGNCTTERRGVSIEVSRSMKA